MTTEDFFLPQTKLLLTSTSAKNPFSRFCLQVFNNCARVNCILFEERRRISILNLTTLIYKDAYFTMSQRFSKRNKKKDKQLNAKCIKKYKHAMFL